MMSLPFIVHLEEFARSHDGKLSFATISFMLHEICLTFIVCVFHNCADACTVQQAQCNVYNIYLNTTNLKPGRSTMVMGDVSPDNKGYTADREILNIEKNKK
jgi:hypothetical protein